MATTEPKKTPPAPVDDAPQEAAIESVWEFIDKMPTVADVRTLLAATVLPHTSTTLEMYLPYVLPITNGKKIKVPLPGDRVGVETKNVSSTVLYVQVAGRIRMFHDMLITNGWTARVYPEPNTPTGAPGYLRMDDRLLFRVYVEIFDKDGDSIGVRFGSAGAKAVGGDAAEATNPYEVVETSALGRALAQWGLGVLPGSGVASVEEMQAVRRALTQQGPRVPQAQAPKSKESRQDLIASAVDWITKNRDVKGFSEDESNRKIGAWVQAKYGIDGFIGDAGEFGWGFLTDAQVTLLRNEMKKSYAQFIAATEGD